MMAASTATPWRQCRQSGPRALLAAVVAAAVMLLVVVGVCVYLARNGEHFRRLRHERVGPPIQQAFQTWATSLDEPQCLHISEELYARNATVADVAVATMLCLSVVLPESLGIGGGFFALYFQKSTGKVHFLDARETAPKAATRDMFVGQKKPTGPTWVGVPGEVRGYEELLNVVGSNLPHRELFQPAIRLAQKGFTVNGHMARALSQKSHLVFASDSMRSVYVNPATNATWTEGSRIVHPTLAATLSRLADADNFADEFYAGPLARELVDAVRAAGGVLTTEDLEGYRTAWRQPSHARLGSRFDVYSAGLPGSGAVLSLMLNIIEAFNMTRLPNDVTTYHRMVEAMKFAYARRSLLGDEDFVPEAATTVRSMQDPQLAHDLRRKISDTATLPLNEYGGELSDIRDHGTSHANFFAPNGDVISITSTINSYFGSGVEVAGILLNNEMDDFSTPNQPNGYGLMPSKSNFIEPGKRPMSSMVPTIVVEDGEARLSLGAAGGSQITSAIGQVLLYYLFENFTLGDAIAYPRLHHQFLPNKILSEHPFDPKIIAQLEDFGHTCRWRPEHKRGSVVVGIAREGDQLVGAADPRKGGGVIGGRVTVPQSSFAPIDSTTAATIQR